MAYGLLQTQEAQPEISQGIFGTAPTTPVNNPWLADYAQSYAPREAAFQAPQNQFTRYHWQGGANGSPAPSQKPGIGLSGGLAGNDDVYQPRPQYQGDGAGGDVYGSGGSDTMQGGSGFDFQMPDYFGDFGAGLSGLLGGEVSAGQVPSGSLFDDGPGVVGIDNQGNPVSPGMFDGYFTGRPTGGFGQAGSTARAIGNIAGPISNLVSTYAAPFALGAGVAELGAINNARASVGLGPMSASQVAMAALSPATMFGMSQPEMQGALATMADRSSPGISMSRANQGNIGPTVGNLPTPGPQPTSGPVGPLATPAAPVSTSMQSILNAIDTAQPTPADQIAAAHQAGVAAMAANAAAMGFGNLGYTGTAADVAAYNSGADGAGGGYSGGGGGEGQGSPSGADW